MKIKATVVYPVYVEINMNSKKYKKMYEDEIDELVIETADKLFNPESVRPIIHEKNYEGKE